MPLFRCYQDTVHRTYVIELSDEAPVKHARAVAEGSATDRVGIEGKVIKEQSPTTSLGVGTSTRILSNSSTTPRRFLMQDMRIALSEDDDVAAFDRDRLFADDIGEVTPFSDHMIRDHGHCNVLAGLRVVC